VSKRRRHAESDAEPRGQVRAEPRAAEVPAGEKRPKSAARNLVETVVVVGALVLFLRGCLVEAFKIPSSSMEPFLLGNPYHGDRVLCWKPSLRLGAPERWSVVVFVKHADPFERMRGETSDRNFIKRVIALPGESLVISGGDVYIEGPESAGHRIARKPPGVQEEVWHTVYEDDLAGGRPGPPSWELEPGLVRDLERGAIMGRAEGRAFARFARNHYDDDSGLVTNLYVRRTRLRVNCPRCGAEFRASFSTSSTRARCPRPSCGGELDALRDLAPARPVGSSPAEQDRPGAGPPSIGRYPATREEEVPVADIRVSFDVRPTRAAGWVLAELGFDDEKWLARVPLAGGEARVAGSRGVEAAGTVRPFPAGAAVRLSFAHVDQTLVLCVGGREIVRAEYEVPWRERAGRPRANTVRIGLEAAELSIEKPRIERDLHYLAQGHAQFVEFYEAGSGFSEIPRRARAGAMPGSGDADAVRTVKLGEGQFFFMGDNSPSSYDSRMWGPVGGKDLVGRAFFLFWPPHRMGLVR